MKPFILMHIPNIEFRLAFDVRNTSDLLCHIAIYDMKEKRKVTENFTFKTSSIESTKNPVRAVFKLEQNRDEYVMFIRFEKTLQGKRDWSFEFYKQRLNWHFITLK